MSRFIISSTFEGFDNPQYYQGHGHCFENGLVSCLQFQVLVYDPDSVEDLISSIELEINGSEFIDCFDLWSKYSETDYTTIERLKGLSVSELWSEQELKDCFEDMKDQVKDILEANNVKDLSDIEDLDFYLYGYIHIYDNQEID